jgi:UDP-N-acetylmuramate dehydrogenase
MNPLPRFPDGLDVRPGARLSDYTTFRLGGPCRALVACSTPDELMRAARACLADGAPFRLIGGGSNLLISDEGLPEIILRYADGRTPPVVRGMEIEVEGAWSADALAATAVDATLDGFTFLTGIPGTVGGALAGNAGAFGEQLGDRLLWAEVGTPGGAVERIAPETFAFSYRASAAEARGWVILRAAFRGAPGVDAALRPERERILEFRRTHHPDWRTTPTAGSFFRNIEPSSRAERRKAAGWFLEEAGARALRVGRARTFERHANIAVLDGPGGRAADVHRLAAWMRELVLRRFNLNLHPEVRSWGRFEEDN